MALRVCILGQANPFAWMCHYVAAFRKRCEVITVGPTFDLATLREWKRTDLADMVQPCDIEISLDKIADLTGILPAGWTPDLVVAISGGGIPMFLNTVSLPCPTVFLSIDTWQCFADHVEARYYDIVFAAQREYVSRLQESGSRHVYWLPLGCNPEAHVPVFEESETHDVAFVGASSLSVHAERARLLRLLAQHFSVLSAECVHGLEMCRLFARGRLAFNHSAVRDLNMRIFEVLSMGRPLLTNEDSAFNGLLDLFEDGKHLIVYRDDGDLLRKTREYLEDDRARRRIAQAGRAEVLQKHTYEHRVESMLEQVRTLFPQLGTLQRPSFRLPSSRLSDWLPRIPGVVVDFGMQLEISRHAARRFNVSRFIGVSRDFVHVQRRRGSYDTVWDNVDALEDASADTVFISDERDLEGMPHSLNHAFRVLAPGGTLVARVSSKEFCRWAKETSVSTESLKKAFLKQGFHVTFAYAAGEGSWIITARKWTRRVRDIVYETFSELQVPGFSAEEVAALLSPDM